MSNWFNTAESPVTVAIFLVKYKLKIIMILIICSETKRTELQSYLSMVLFPLASPISILLTNTNKKLLQISWVNGSDFFFLFGGGGSV